MNSHFLRITNSVEFETLCCDIAKEKYSDYNAQKYGRSGQKQWGVDIKATDKKNGKLVVIQSKFKTNPPKFGKNASREKQYIKNEILQELGDALKKHNFHVFIYASNIPNDTEIQDFAISLSGEYKIEVIIWSQITIEDDILFYPRLTRLYTERGNKNGVQIIDKDFLDVLVYNDSIKHSIYRFYTGNANDNEQWLGIINNWDAPRKSKSLIDEKIKYYFGQKSITSKIVSLIFGDAGSGKSTLLRRIAVDNVKNNNYVNWWITDLEVFLDYDTNSVSEAAHYSEQLLFIEDWYRTVEYSVN